MFAHNPNTTQTMEEQLSLLRERGNAAFRENNYEEAADFYATSLSLKKDGVIHSNLSLLLLKLGDAEGSLREAEAAIALAPTFVKGYVRKGVALLAMSRVEEARDAYLDGLSVCFFFVRLVVFCFCLFAFFYSHLTPARPIKRALSERRERV